MNLALYSPTAPLAGVYPGYGWNGLRVHSHTSPNIWRIPWAAGAAMGLKRPLSAKLPSRDAVLPAACSHSASVGSRLPAHRANASASKRSEERRVGEERRSERA